MKAGTMRRILLVSLALVLIASIFAPAAQAQASAPQTYKVLVGWENPKQGVDLSAFFPGTVTIHVGDTVHWVQNSVEIHTVTFLDGAPAPELIQPAPPNLPSPLMLNPDIAFPTVPANNQYNGQGYANSGVMSTGPGQPTSFDLTFTQAGTYDYICLVHGVTMSGKVVVVGAGIAVNSPAKAAAKGQQQIAALLAKVPGVFAEAAKMVTHPSRNPDGSKTYHVLLGYGKGQIDLMRFFPRRLEVRPGDTVVWDLPGMGMLAPHTITFLNGATGADLAMPYQVPNGPFLILVNPAVLFPSQPGPTLTQTGIYNSGLLNPGGGPQSYSLKIGDITGPIAYECLLHDGSGMSGTLVVDR